MCEANEKVGGANIPNGINSPPENHIGTSFQISINPAGNNMDIHHPNIHPFEQSSNLSGYISNPSDLVITPVLLSSDGNGHRQRMQQNQQHLPINQQQQQQHQMLHQQQVQVQVSPFVVAEVEEGYRMLRNDHVEHSNPYYPNRNSGYEQHFTPAGDETGGPLPEDELSWFRSINSLPPDELARWTELARSSTAKAHLESIPCKICADKASGIHYGVITCEGCKGFFRRSHQNSAKYSCPRNNDCQIDRTNRNRCQACRLKKCHDVGMSRDAVKFGRMSKKQRHILFLEVLNHYQAAENGKRVRQILIASQRQQQQQQQQQQPQGLISNEVAQYQHQVVIPNDNGGGHHFVQSNCHPSSHEGAVSSPSPSMSTPSPSNHAAPQQSQQCGLRHVGQMVVTNGVMHGIYGGGIMAQVLPDEFVELNEASNSSAQTAMQHRMELPQIGFYPVHSPQIDNLGRSIRNAYRETSQFLLQHLATLFDSINGDADVENFKKMSKKDMWQKCLIEMDKALQAIFDFARKIQFFLQLCQQDQINLFAPACFEILLVRMCRAFSFNNRFVLFGDDFTGMETFNSLGCNDLVRTVFECGSFLSRLRLNEDEIALFSCVILFTADRPNLSQPQMIRDFRSRVLGLLHQSLLSSHSEDPDFLLTVLSATSNLCKASSMHKFYAQNTTQEFPDIQLPAFYKNIFLSETQPATFSGNIPSIVEFAGFGSSRPEIKIEPAISPNWRDVLDTNGNSSDGTSAEDEQFNDVEEVLLLHTTTKRPQEHPVFQYCDAATNGASYVDVNGARFVNEMAGNDIAECSILNADGGNGIGGVVSDHATVVDVPLRGNMSGLEQLSREFENISQAQGDPDSIRIFSTESLPPVQSFRTVRLQNSLGIQHVRHNLQEQYEAVQDLQQNMRLENPVSIPIDLTLVENGSSEIIS